MKKCLIIVPHPDDEINVGCGVIDQLIYYGVEVVVAFATNGFAPYRDKNYRIREALNAKAILGYDRIITMGFEDGELYEQYECLKQYLKKILHAEMPDLIICCDVDEHPDHRTLSLAFDEVIGELLKDKVFWRPIILKKFAYVGVYKGIDDYFRKEMPQTSPSYFKTEDENLVYPYKWDNRTCFINSENNYPSMFWRSPIFRALRCHESQQARAHFGQICNADTCYWFRSIDSITYRCEINVSSGDARYLNDFKIIDTDDVHNKSTCIKPSLERCWHPETTRFDPFVEFRLPERISLKYIRIYLPIMSSFRVDIYFDGLLVKSQECKNELLMDIVTSSHSCPKSVKLKFCPMDNSKIYISEIEMYEEYPTFPWECVPLKEYKKEVVQSRKGVLWSFLIYNLIVKLEPLRMRWFHLKSKLIMSL